MDQKVRNMRIKIYPHKCYVLEADGQIDVLRGRMAELGVQVEKHEVVDVVTFRLSYGGEIMPNQAFVCARDWAIAHSVEYSFE